VRCSSNCIAAMARTTALRRSKDDLAAANPATPLLTFALDFHRKESVCGGHGPSLTGSLLSPASGVEEITIEDGRLLAGKDLTFIDERASSGSFAEP